MALDQSSYTDLLDNLLTGAEGYLDGAVNHWVDQLLYSSLYRWTNTVPELGMCLEDGQLYKQNKDKEINYHKTYLVQVDVKYLMWSVRLIQIITFCELNVITIIKFTLKESLNTLLSMHGKVNAMTSSQYHWVMTSKNITE